LNPKRTNDVLRKPDNCKSYGQLLHSGTARAQSETKMGVASAHAGGASRLLRGVGPVDRVMRSQLRF